MKKYIVLMAIFLNGCYTQVTSLREYLPPSQLSDQYESINAVLFNYLTPDAYLAVKDIPVYIKSSDGGFAAGTSDSSSIAQFLMGGGFGRKVYLTEESLKNWGVEAILHEFIHHLDDMTRDGDGDFISIEEFEIGYASCYGDVRYHGLTRHTESSNAANKFITDNFGIGRHSERIAYCGARLYKQDCPEALKYAYRKIYKKYMDSKMPEEFRIHEEFLNALRNE